MDKELRTGSRIAGVETTFPTHASRREFVHLYEKWWDFVVQEAARYLPCRHDCEGVGQRVFLKLLAGRNRAWRSIRNPRRYFARAARNQAFHTLRQHHIQQRISEDLRWMEGSSSPPEQITVDAYATLSKLLARLPPRCRDVVRLRALVGMTVAEIASHMDVSPKAVEKQLARARRRLSGHMSLSRGDSNDASATVSSFEDGGG